MQHATPINDNRTLCAIVRGMDIDEKKIFSWVCVQELDSRLIFGLRLCFQQHKKGTNHEESQIKIVSDAITTNHLSDGPNRK